METFLFTYAPSRFDSNPAAGDLDFSAIANVVGSWWWVAAIFAFEKAGKTLKKSSNSDRWLLRYNFLSSTPSILVQFNRFDPEPPKKSLFFIFVTFLTKNGC